MSPRQYRVTLRGVRDENAARLIREQTARLNALEKVLRDLLRDFKDLQFTVFAMESRLREEADAP